MSRRGAIPAGSPTVSQVCDVTSHITVLTVPSRTHFFPHSTQADPSSSSSDPQDRPPHARPPGIVHDHVAPRHCRQTWGQLGLCPGRHLSGGPGPLSAPPARSRCPRPAVGLGVLAPVTHSTLGAEQPSSAAFPPSLRPPRALHLHSPIVTVLCLTKTVTRTSAGTARVRGGTRKPSRQVVCPLQGAGQ